MTAVMSYPVPAAAQTVAPQRLLAAAAGSLDDHLHRNGPIPWRSGPRDGGGSDLLVQSLEAAGLTGRGGAGFPTWRKVTSAANAAGRRPVVVANAAEGEPASAKDATLLALAPHLVLDGLQLAAEAVGADQAYVYAKAGEGLAAVRRALAERSARGVDRCPVLVHEAPPGFVSGEESAVVSAIEGGPALPRTKRYLVSERGVQGRPTLLQNAETLAHVALIARQGAAWFRTAGTPAEPGTFLATVGGAVQHAGVFEAEYGVGLGDLLAAAGGPAAEVGAVLVGGYHGVWVPADVIATTAVSRQGLARWGGSPGAGVVWALPAAACGLSATASIVTYLAGQSARQCGPCAFGLPTIAADLTVLADLPRRADRNGRAATGRTADPTGLPARIAAFAGVVDGRGACRHPDGTVRLVRSALGVFADDVAVHLSGRCLAAR